MNTLKNFNPIVLLIYFIYVLFISIFSFNPILLISGMLGAVLYCLVVSDKRSLLKSIAACIIILLAVTITNPLFSHNGKTVLFFINDNRVTLEAFVYGAVLGLCITEVILWFNCFNLVFDTERFIFLFGKISPKLALVLSMTLRFIPNFIKSFREINRTQKLISNKRRLKRYLNSFSAVITQAMENSIITSDSMNSRGYGSKKRTFYSRFRFTLSDAVFLIITSVLFVLSVVYKTDFTYYPELIFPSINFLEALGYLSFIILTFIPFIYELKEGIRWKYLISKI
ncbi:MAG: energy-coupling factor transporter transmembrane component T [Ruminococcus sp.]|nr:energy-coupling factor transporter transmembrane component T [Ruminococcus sp.]